VQQLEVDWADLELAFRDATGTENYLDTRSGAVVSILSGFDDERDLRDQLVRFPGRFLRIAPLDAGFTKRVLEAFATSLPKSELRARLDEVRHGAGGVARSIQVLHEEARTWAQWSRFEQGELWQEVARFLVAHGIAAPRAPTVDLFEGVSEAAELEAAVAAAPAPPPAAPARRRSGKRA
jgi:hypothetical protein